MSDSKNNKEAIRRKVIGLGEDSVTKSYYPQLQQHIHDLQLQTKALEVKTTELNETIKDLEATKALLAVSENKFRALFENANDAIFIFTSSKICIECNNKAIDLLQFENKDEILGLSLFDLSPKYQTNGRLTVKELEKFIGRALNGDSQIFDWLIRRRDNNIAYCEVSLSSMNINGEEYIQAIVRDITNYKKLERNFSLATIRTEERERLRFSKELHDGIGPILSTIKLYLQWLSDTDNQEHIKIIKKKINESINEATKSIKEVSHNLSPHVLTNYGLVEALNIFVKRINESGKLNIILNHNLIGRLDKDLEIMFYRVCTELINNTVKHAEATQSKIKFKQEDDVIQFIYLDDGKGLSKKDQDKTDTGIGLYNIINRVKSVGGICNYNYPNHKGFKIKIIISKNSGLLGKDIAPD